MPSLSEKELSEERPTAPSSLLLKRFFSDVITRGVGKSSVEMPHPPFHPALKPVCLVITQAVGPEACLLPLNAGNVFRPSPPVLFLPQATSRHLLCALCTPLHRECCYHS